MAGQGTAALELLEQIERAVDIVMAPVGGGGLIRRHWHLQLKP